MNGPRGLAVMAAFTIAATIGADQHPNVVKGFDPNGVFHMNDLDHINAFNGNLTVSIPIGQPYSIGGGLTYQLRLYSNSNIWDSEERMDLGDDLEGQNDPDCRPPGTAIPEPCIQAYPDRRANAGVGWTLSMGRLFPPWEQTNGSAEWVYESPDGSEHAFFRDLHRDRPEQAGHEADDGVFYTRDGTYLRMRGTGNRQTVEFPNGEIHTFMSPDGAAASTTAAGDLLRPWVLAKIGNRFAPNVLTATYVPATGPTERIILSEGPEANPTRSHTIYFTLDLPFESGILTMSSPEDPPKINMRRLVDHVEVAAFGGAKSRYSFVYDEVLLTRPDWHTVPMPHADLSATVQRLRTLQLPDATAFRFDYETAYPDSGLLNEMVLPTGGRIEWTYGSYEFPSHSAQGLVHVSRVAGVTERRVYRDGVTAQTWKYTPALDIPYNSPTPPRQLKTTVEDPLGNLTEQYFDVSSQNQSSVRYGLPFSVLVSDGTGRYLSTKSIPAGQTASRSTFVRYELDAAGVAGAISPRDRSNVRQASSRTVFEDGTDFQVSDTVFDGLGHYRTREQNADGVTRTTTTTYNSARGSYPGTFTFIPPTDPWILNTFDTVTVTEGVNSRRTKYCFDAPTGFLQRVRTLRGAGIDSRNDLLTIYTAAPNGDVQREEYFGGDATPLPTDFDWQCNSQAFGTAAFTLSHTYAAGARATTKHLGAAFFALNLTIDAASGLPKSSRDVSGVETAFAYDSLGRITKVAPTGSAWSEYVYTWSSAAARPMVTATQFAENAAASAGTELGQSVFYFDGLGNVVQESRRMPDGWSRTTRTYDALGRPEKVYSPVQQGDSAYVAVTSGPATTSTYDGFGRITSTVQPDGSATTVAYKKRGTGTTLLDSSRVKRTTSRVRTSAIAGTADEASTVEEETDGFGRMVRVTEDADTAARTDTTYGYDLGDRLSTVTMGVQGRTFNYDHAGFLLSETHPESNTTAYSYDARGRVISRQTPATEMTYEYDSAERLRTVFADGEVLKEFTFYGSGAALGKLQAATRHNRYDVTTASGSPKTDVTVKETFTYDAAGRIEQKETAVTPGVTFTDEYDYDALGAVGEITYPECTGCTGWSGLPRKVVTARTFGYLTAVGPYASDIQYHSNGLLKSLTHRNVDGTAGPIYEQAADGSMPRPGQISVSNVCDQLRITTHPGSRTEGNGTSVPLEANAVGHTSWQWYERTATGDRAIAGETDATMVVTAGTTKLYFARARGAGNCTADSAVATVTGVSACGTDATITVTDPIQAGSTHTASVPHTPGATYSWNITGGSIAGSASDRTVTFTAACSTPLTLSVTVTVSGCVTANGRTVDVLVPTAHVSGSTTISGGATAAIIANFTGTGPWTVTWSDIGPVTYSASSVTRNVGPATTTTYAITHITTATCNVANGGTTATITVNETCTAPPLDPSWLTVEQPVASAPTLIRVSAQEGETFSWTITNGALLSADSVGRAYYRPNCSGSVGITVKVTSRCGLSVTKTTTLAIPRPRVEILPANSSFTYLPGSAGVELEVQVTNTYRGRLTWSDGVFEPTGVSKNGGTYTRSVKPEATRTYTVTEAANYYGCAADTVGAAVVTVCESPDATITAPSTIVSKGTHTASVPATAGASYVWSVVAGGTIIGSATASSVTFENSACSGSVQLQVTVTSSCGAVTQRARTIVVVAPTAVAGGATTIAQGSSTSIQATMSGVSPWIVKWSDQAAGAPAASSPSDRVVTPQGTTTYALSSVTDHVGCVATLSGSAIVTVLPPAPAAVAARATSATTVQVTWTTGGTVDSVELYRNGLRIAQAAQSPYTDTTVQAATAYLYHAVAVKSGTSSAASTPDLATTVMLLPDPILPDATIISAAHITQLRAAVNAVRLLSGLPNAAFTDASLAGVHAKAVHVTELRTALDEARIRLLLAPTGRSRPSLVSGASIAAVDIMDVRGGVR